MVQAGTGLGQHDSRANVWGRCAVRMGSRKVRCCVSTGASTAPHVSIPFTLGNCDLAISGRHV